MKKSSTIHAVFECLDCGKSWDDYRTAQDQARKHAKSTGHHVSGEVAKYVVYNSKN